MTVLFVEALIMRVLCRGRIDAVAATASGSVVWPFEVSIDDV